MKQAIDLYSPLSPTEIASKLKKIMDDDMPNAKARVYGGGTQYDIELRYVRRNFRDSTAPALKAEMEDYEGGTRIRGDLGPSPMRKYFKLIWFGFLSIFILFGFFAMIFVRGAWLFGLMFAGLPIVMAGIGALVFRLAPNTDGDGDEIMAFLRRELDVRSLV